MGCRTNFCLVNSETSFAEQNEPENTELAGLEQLQQEFKSNKQKLTELRSQLKQVEERIQQARKTNIFGRKQSGENERERERLIQEIKDTKNSRGRIENATTVACNPTSKNKGAKKVTEKMGGKKILEYETYAREDRIFSLPWYLSQSNIV